jgi:hypothetical protein
VLNLNTDQMVAVKIGFDGLGGGNCAAYAEGRPRQVVVHPSIVNYEKMARDEYMLRIVLLKCVVPLLLYAPAFSLLRILTLGPGCPPRSDLQIGLEWLNWADSQGVRQIERDPKAANILTTKTGNVKLACRLTCARRSTRSRRSRARRTGWSQKS